MQVNNQAQLYQQIVQLLESKQSKEHSIVLNQKLYDQLKIIVDSSRLPDRVAETKNVTILLSDLRGFTAMSEKYSPLVVIELLNRYFSKMSEVIDHHGGVIDKFMGDSIMVLFGAIEDSQSDLQNAIACAIAMQIAMSEINRISTSLGMASLFMGIGINTGEVVAGTLGSDIYREYTVIGDEVNLASRVEAHSLRGQILLTENSYRIAKDYIEVGDINEVMVKGKSKPIRMYELCSMSQPEPLQVPCREIRKSPRVAVDIPIEFKQLQGKQILDRNYQGRVIDISYGGLFINSSLHLEPFSEIIMTLSLPLIGDDEQPIYAQVLNSANVGEAHETHLEFTSLGEVTSKAIKSYVDQII